MNPPDHERLLAAPFPLQQTYWTPLDDLERFVVSIRDAFKVRTASVWIETLVFNPSELIWYLREPGIHANEGQLNESLLLAESKTEAATLHESVLGQWADFAVLPSTREFVIYADHDEFATVFTKSSERLGFFCKQMKAAGFKEIQDWTWTGPRSSRKQERATPDV